MGSAGNAQESLVRCGIAGAVGTAGALSEIVSDGEQHAGNHFVAGDLVGPFPHENGVTQTVGDIANAAVAVTPECAGAAGRAILVVAGFVGAMVGIVIGGDIVGEGDADVGGSAARGIEVVNRVTGVGVLLRAGVGRAAEDGVGLLHGGNVPTEGIAGGGVADIKTVVDRAQFDVRCDETGPGPVAFVIADIGVDHINGRQHAERGIVIVNGQAELLEVVFATAAAGCFPRLLDRREEQGNQNRNDGDDDEQFNQGKSPRTK